MLAISQKRVGILNLGKQQMCCTLKTFSGVISQIDLAHSREQMAITTQPVHIATIESDRKVLRLLERYHPIALNTGINLPQRFAIVSAPIPVQIQPDHTEAYRKLHVLITY